MFDTYTQKIARQLGVGVESIRAEFRTLSIPERRSEVEEPARQLNPVARPALQEFWLLKLLFTDEHLVELARRSLDLSWITSPPVRSIVSLVFRTFEEGAWSGVPSLLHQLQDEEMLQLANEAVVDERDLPNREQQLTDCIRGLRDRFIDREMAVLNAELGSASADQMQPIQIRQSRLLALKRSPV